MNDPEQRFATSLPTPQEAAREALCLPRDRTQDAVDHTWWCGTHSRPEPCDAAPVLALAEIIRSRDKAVRRDMWARLSPAEVTALAVEKGVLARKPVARSFLPVGAPPAFRFVVGDEATP